jgi:hypothetical protein
MRRTALTAAALAAGIVLFAGCYPPVPAGDDFATRWAKEMSGATNEDEIDGVAAAPDGSTFVTGKFEATATFGGVTLHSAGHADVPVAHFSPLGQTLWVNRYGGSGEDNLFDIDADAHGAVGTGWFEGTVDFGSVRATSSGASDCVVVALNNDGTTLWVRTFGGPYRDGCNEVSIAADGSIVTSLDTEGGWTPPGLAAIPHLARCDTLLVRLAPDGRTLWMRRVGGDGPQRGKSIAVAPDGSIAFGGDSIGALTAGGSTWTVPGGARDAWMSRWSKTGALQWVKTWGGPGDDLAKGLAETSDAVYAVGAVTGTVHIDGATIAAGTNADLAVVKFAPDGALQWATSVTADAGIDGAEITTARDGGVLFGASSVAGMRFRQTRGSAVALDAHDGGVGWLAHYGPDGTVQFATTIAGTANGRPGEIARTGARVYLDVVLRGRDNTINGAPLPAQGKDASVWAIDLATRS